MLQFKSPCIRDVHFCESLCSELRRRFIADTHGQGTGGIISLSLSLRHSLATASVLLGFELKVNSSQECWRVELCSSAFFDRRAQTSNKTQRSEQHF